MLDVELVVEVVDEVLEVDVDVNVVEVELWEKWYWISSCLTS